MTEERILARNSGTSGRKDKIMKKMYNAPVSEIVTFDSADVITASNGSHMIGTAGGDNRYTTGSDGTIRDNITGNTWRN